LPVIEVHKVVREFGSIVPATCTPPCIVSCATTTGSSLPKKTNPVGDRRPSCWRATKRGASPPNIAKLPELLRRT
jgi:hypothetical protein